MSSTVTVETAPRDLDVLAKLGRFQLRQLAEKLGMFSDDVQKAAFMGLPNDKMAGELLGRLQALDGESKGGKAPKAVRTPSNGGKVAGTATATPAVKSAPAPTGNNGLGVAEILTAINGMRDEVKALSERLDTVDSSIDEVRIIVKGTNRLSFVGFNLSLMLAEQVLDGAGREDVLAAATGDVDMTTGMIEKLAPNLLNASDEDEEAEGEEAGN